MGSTDFLYSKGFVILLFVPFVNITAWGINTYTHAYVYNVHDVCNVL